MEELKYEVIQVRRAVHFQCWDCGEADPNYMVHNTVWKEAWAKGDHPHKLVLRKHADRLFPDALRSRNADRKGHYHVLVHVRLCFSCLEKRIGRKLTLADFILTNSRGDVLPINAALLFGFQLGVTHTEKVYAKTASKTGDKKNEGG